MEPHPCCLSLSPTLSCSWFVSVDYTDPNLVKQVFARGHGELLLGNSRLGW